MRGNTRAQMGTGTAKLPLFPQPNLFLPISVWWMAFYYHAMATDWKISLPLPCFCVCSNICPGFNQKQADTHTFVQATHSHRVMELAKIRMDQKETENMKSGKEAWKWGGQRLWAPSDDFLLLFTSETKQIEHRVTIIQGQYPFLVAYLPKNVPFFIVHSKHKGYVSGKHKVRPGSTGVL